MNEDKKIEEPVEDEALEVVSEDSGEAGNAEVKNVTPFVHKMKIGHRTGVKKGHLVPILAKVKDIILQETLACYEGAGRPEIENDQPIGFSLVFKPAFLVGMLDDLKQFPEPAVVVKFKTSNLQEDGSEGPTFAPEQIIQDAVEFGFFKLSEFAGALEAEWDEGRSYKGWLHVAWVWNKPPEPEEVH